ncbi:hypothetical protein E8E11_007119 [Didymella keratinophila]|nr:hypothetical protein E8E11_007119 [Didymella keratinophila]
MQNLPCRPGVAQLSQTRLIAKANASTITITVLNQFLSRFLDIPPHIHQKILIFALSGHDFRIYSFNGQVRPRVCPECYFGLPYAMALGPPVRITWLLALSYVSNQV